MSRIAKAVVLSMGVAASVAGATGVAAAHAAAGGGAMNSEGLVAGNVVQVPLHVPINFCGNTLTLVGALNPAFGNTCVNA
ncbi:chaplin [Streptomyces sp. ISL-36]|uniref:chaplin n=1 Tax=Streptomyces sp. ISL-36 TaxID=2819182 RepID=UPI001BEA6A51|nr:chaplin [Streptomyces sp. ISL-36]MBT2439441.1 chaplin [Streptomyces sp. ISL-36]